MAIAGQLPKHLEVAARTGVLTAKPNDRMPYRRVAQEIDLTSATSLLVDLGGVPIPTQDPKIVDDLIERFKEVEPLDWYITIPISQNAIDDDQTGTLLTKFKGVLPAFERHINSRVFTILNGGDGTTYGLCYDGLNMFSASHVDKGAKYTTVQDNVSALALSDDNFNTVWVAAQSVKDDKGNYTEFMYDLLVTSPTLRKTAHQLANNPKISGSANNDENPYEGEVQYITAPQMDATAWVLVASNESTKPIIVGVRKRPQLIDMKFDSQAGDGGVHYFVYHARHNEVYGDWRLAHMGNS